MACLTRQKDKYYRVHWKSTVTAGPETGRQQKLLNYQLLFDSERYRRCESILQCPLRGFRVLFLTIHPGRLAALCRLVREMPPSDFVWLTDRSRMAATAIWAPIWVRGGRDTEPPDSILGTQMPDPCPPPDVV